MLKRHGEIYTLYTATKLGKETKINGFWQTVPHIEDTFSEKMNISSRMTLTELEFVATGINTNTIIITVTVDLSFREDIKMHFL